MCIVVGMVSRRSKERLSLAWLRIKLRASRHLKSVKRFANNNRWALTEIAGFVLVSVGVAMIWFPAGMMFGGVSLLATVWLRSPESD